MKALLEVVKFNAQDIITTGSGCKIPNQLKDECDPDME